MYIFLKPGAGAGTEKKEFARLVRDSACRHVFAVGAERQGNFKRRRRSCWTKRRQRKEGGHQETATLSITGELA